MESVVSVHPDQEFHLRLRFNTGETRLFDARPYLDKGAFQRLRDKHLFNQAYVAFDTVCWPGNLDIAPETLYDRSVLIGEAEFTHSDRTPQSSPSSTGEAV